MTTSWIQQARASGSLRAQDMYFALQMQSLNKQGSSELLLACIVVSQALAKGHVCINLAEYANKTYFAENGTEGVYIPDVEIWIKALKNCSIVGMNDNSSPLMLDGEYLYIGRLWSYEQRLLVSLLDRVQSGENVIEHELIKEQVDKLFPDLAEDTDWQVVATVMAALKNTCVISGGPGTGKTFTVAKILALLISLADPEPLRIALAAPTGKAAARMSESLNRVKSTLNLSASVIDAFPDEARTLHRLLGFRPGKVKPRFNQDNLLPLDILIVDEASMIDLPMMSWLLQAISPDCRLILLGDKDQLASVEAGSVMGDICGRHEAECFSRTMVNGLKLLTGYDLPHCPTREIQDHIVSLKRSYRFDETSGISALATSVNEGNVKQALQVLQNPAYNDIDLVNVDTEQFKKQLEHFVVPVYRNYLQCEDQQQIHAKFNQLRILCATHDGLQGIHSINRMVESCLSSAGLIKTDSLYYHGRPVMITQNDHSLGLYNGDVGIVMSSNDVDSIPEVIFETSEGLRSVHPARLPPHQTVYAMSVHKSQGSEFETVLMILPDKESPLLTRELLYTAITRAKLKVTLWGSASQVTKSIQTKTQRDSGIYRKLWQ